MTNRRLEPAASDPSFLVLRALAGQLRTEVARRLRGRDALAVLDVGCGSKPYQSVLAPYASHHLGVAAVGGPSVDVVAPAESLPFDDGTFDCVLSTQVLEHVANPTEAVAEIRRMLRPGGVAYVSTHGINRYHPVPNDYWRWTHTGLERLFHTAGDWRTIDVYANGGNGTALAYLLGHQLGSVLKRTHLRFVTPIIGLLLNVVGRK